MTDAPADVLSPDQRDQIGEFLGNPLQYPEEFKQWLTDYLATNIPPIPVSQLLGYKGTLARYDFVSTYETLTTPERVWVDLATVGPKIDQLADGIYWAAWGFYCDGTMAGSQTSRMGLGVNGADPTTYAQAIALDDGKQAWRAVQLNVKNGTDNNTVTAKYYADLGGGATSEFRRRWMTMLRIT